DAPVGRPRDPREPVRSQQRGHRRRGQAGLQRAVSPRGEPGAARRRVPVRALPGPAREGPLMGAPPAALLDEVIEDLCARHTTDVEVAAIARREYEERRGRVHQEDELWEPWSAAFVEWFVVERLADGHAVPPAALSLGEL